MTWVDLAVLGVLLLSALFAFMRGLVREVLGLAAWVGAIFAGVWSVPRVRPRFQEWLGTSSPWVDPAAFAAVFIIALIVLLLISRWISAFVRASPISGIDRTLGLVFGLARGAVLLVLAYIGAGMVVPVNRWPDPVLNAESVWPVYRAATWVVERLPQEFQPNRPAEPPRRREATAAALLQAMPQGRAVTR
jgi:membrane protein required for colicin V production